ncbi:MAG TPA: hypothetical protein DCE27_05640, partial [Xanthomarina gelatinilytica]|nr:hypothetical protein [Xanthomarina gelatinilytica]
PIRFQIKATILTIQNHNGGLFVEMSVINWFELVVNRITRYKKFGSCLKWIIFDNQIKQSRVQ